jgi:hypothetical protein
LPARERGRRPQVDDATGADGEARANEEALRPLLVRFLSSPAFV